MQRFGLLCVSRYAVMLIGFAVAGCSGHGGALPSMPGGMPSSRLAPGKIDPRTTMLQQRLVQQLRAGRVAQVTLHAAVAPAGYPTSLHPPKNGSSAGGNDNEGLGFAISAGGTYTGLLAAHSAYRPNDFTVTFPASSPSSLSYIQAPVGYPPNGSCLAVGSVFASTSSAISNSFVVYNLCGGGAWVYPIDDWFKGHFIQPTQNKVPSYYTFTYTVDQHPTSTSIWHTLLYDFVTSQWEEVQEVTGLGSVTSGAEVFSAKLAQGLCPNIPAIAADQIALFDAHTYGFEFLKPSMSQGTTSTFAGPGGASCFTDDGTHNGGVYQYADFPNYLWIVGLKPGTQTGKATEFTLPTNSSSPSAIAAGPDGALWFTEYSSNNIGRITTRGTITEFAIPTSPAGANGITANLDGALWFTEQQANNIGRITVSGVITEYVIPTTNSGPDAIAAARDGSLWFTEQYANKIGRITTDGTITEFAIPTANSDPIGIAAGPDGALWFAEGSGNKIGRMTTNGSITEFPIPTPSSGASYITPGPDGALWFTENVANQIGRITTTGAVTEFAIPTGTSLPEGIVAGADGAVWFAEDNTSQIGRITTAGAISEFSIPTASSAPSGVTSGPDGAVWFTEYSANKIGRMLP